MFRDIKFSMGIHSLPHKWADNSPIFRVTLSKIGKLPRFGNWSPFVLKASLMVSYPDSTTTNLFPNCREYTSPNFFLNSLKLSLWSFLSRCRCPMIGRLTPGVGGRGGEYVFRLRNNHRIRGTVVTAKTVVTMETSLNALNILYARVSGAH